LIPAKEHKQLSLFNVFDQLIFTKDSTGMAIKPYLIEVIGIDFLHVVEFSRYGCALIPGLTTDGRAQLPPRLGQKEKPRPPSRKGQIAQRILSAMSP
jgi:hypothetical protein